jgi:hypothetical protein
VYLISHQSAEHGALVHKCFALTNSAVASSTEAQQALLQVGVWCIGEYGEGLLTQPPKPTDDSTGPVGDQRTEQEVRDSAPHHARAPSTTN